MRHGLSLVGVSILVLAGCASMGVHDGDRRFTGVVESSYKVTRAGEPSGALMAFGAIGGLLHSAASGPTPTNSYQVRVSGETFTAHADEDYAIGTCVDIIPAKDATGFRFYAYGQARMAVSDKCNKETTPR